MGGSGSQTQTQQLPAWAQPYAKEGVQSLFGNVLPGGQPAPYPLPDQSVAPMTADQAAAFQGAREMPANITGLYSPYAPGAMNTFLDPYAQAASRSLIQQYQTATEPGIMSRAAQTGNIGSASTAQSLQGAQEALGQSLGDLNARIYEPAYESAQSRGLQAAQAQTGQQMAANQLLSGYGSEQQQQQQNILDTAYKNAYTRAMWPYTIYDRIAQDFGGLMGNQLTTKISGGSK